MDNGASSYRRFREHGDESGLVEIIRDYKDGLIFYLNSFVGNIHIAEELTEDTFVLLATKKPKDKNKGTFKTWLYAIGRNIAIDYLRKHAKRKEIPTQIIMEYQKQAFTFEEIILLSDVCIVGECGETIWNENYGEVKFEVKECLYGNVTDKEIYLYSNLPLADGQFACGYSVAAEDYEKGKTYILILEKRQSILYDRDRYMQIDSDLYMCEDSEEYILDSQVVEIPEGMGIKDYICSVYNSVSHLEEEVPPVYASELEEMVGESTFVGVVKILDLVTEGTTYNGNLYRVRVESLLKEDVHLNQWAVFITILKDTVEIGESYIIGFSPVSDGSSIHRQTTKTGVYEVNDEILAEIERILAE